MNDKSNCALTLTRQMVETDWVDTLSRKVNVPQRTILDWRRALGVKRGPGGVAA